MSVVNLWASKGFTEAVDKAVGATKASYFSFPDNWEVVVDAEVDVKIVKKLQEDPRLHQVVRDACKSEYDKLVQAFGGALADLNKGLVSGKTSLEDVDDAFKLVFSDQVLGPNVQKCVKAMTVVVGKAMTDYCQVNAEYKQYKFVILVKIGLCVGGVIVSLAFIVSSFFDVGVGVIVGAITLGLSCVKLASLIHETSCDCIDELCLVHKIFKELDKNLHKKHEKTKNFSKEIANEFGSAIIGLKLFLGTVKNAIEHLDAAELKLKSYDLVLIKLSKKLQKVLKKLDAFEQLEAQRKVILKEVRPKDPVLKVKLQKLSQKIAAILAKIDKVNDVKNFLSKVLVEAQGYMVEIQKNMVSTKKEMMDKIVEVVSKLLFLTDAAVAVVIGDVVGLAFAAADLGLQFIDYLAVEYVIAENKKYSEVFIVAEISGLKAK